jgi:hypothetical protein
MGIYELVPDSASDLQEVQQPPPSEEVPAGQDLSPTPAPEYQRGKHRCISLILKYPHYVIVLVH